MPDLVIDNLHVAAGDKEILKGLSLTVRQGEVHALMGPNGSGKSTLANAIMGNPQLEVTAGTIRFGDTDITELDPDERSRLGLFMAFQYPVAIPGVTITKYLRMVMNAHREARGEPEISLKDFRKTVEAAMALCKAAGAKRAVPLQVSGAFHSPLMAPARDALEAALAAAELRDPSVPVYANVTAAPVRTAGEARALLGEQLTGAVRWTDLVRRIAADHPGVVFVECGPGTVLQGLVRKIVPGAEVWPAGTAADVETILSKVA